MPKQTKKTNVEQSPLDPDMENEADQIADTLVSEVLNRAAGNVSELMGTIDRWMTEEQSKSGPSDGNKDESPVTCCINRKLGPELHRFFSKRRVFAEHREPTEEDAATSSSTSKNTKPGEAASKSDTQKEKQTGRFSRFLCKKAKSTGKNATFFGKKSGKPAPDQHKAEEAKTSSQSSSLPKKASSVIPVCSTDGIKTATKPDLSTVTLKEVDDKKDNVLTVEDLVTDSDRTPGTSQIQQGSDHVDVVVSPSKDTETKPTEMSPTASAPTNKDISVTVEADKTQTSSESDSKKSRQTGRYKRFFCNPVKPTGNGGARFGKKTGKSHSVPDQQKEEVAESSIQSSSVPKKASSAIPVCSTDDIRTATKSGLSTVPLKQVDDNKDNVLTVEDLVTDSDRTPGTSQIQQGSDHVDVVVKPATSDVPSKDTETKPTQMSPTASASTSEDINVTVEANKTQASSKLDPKKARQTGRYNKVSFNTAKPTESTTVRKKTGNMSRSVPNQYEKKAAESNSQRSSLPKKASSVAVVRPVNDIKTATKSDLSTVPLKQVDVDIKDEDVTPEEFMKKDLVTDIDATPGTSQIQQGSEHVDVVVRPATSDSPSEDFETKPAEMSPTASASSSEDIIAVVEADKTQPPSKSAKERKTGRPGILSKMMKFFMMKTEDKDEEAYEEAVAQETSPLRSTSAKSDLSTAPLELQDLVNEDEDVLSKEFMQVADLDATPGTSQVHVGGEQVSVVIGSTTSNSPSKGIKTKSTEMSPTVSTSSKEDISVTVKVDKSEPSSESDSEQETQTERRKGFLCKVKNMTKLFRKKTKDTAHPVPDQHEEEAAESSSQKSSPPKDLVTDMDATSGTSQIQQGSDHEDVVVRSATNDSPFEDTDTKPTEMSPTASASSSEDINAVVEADKTQERQTERPAGFLSKMVKFLRLGKDKGEEAHEEAVAQETSSLTSVCSTDDIRTTGHPIPDQHEEEAAESSSQSSSPPKDLVTDIDATPGTSQIQQGSDHEDVVVRSATNDSPFEDTETKPTEMSPTASASSSEDINAVVEADKTQERQTERPAGFLSKMVKFLRLGKGKGEEAHEEAVAQETSSLTSVCSTDDIRTTGHPIPDQHEEEAAESSSQSSSPPKDLVATPGTSQTKPGEMSRPASSSSSSSNNIVDTAEADQTQTTTEPEKEEETGKGAGVVSKKWNFMDLFKKKKIHPNAHQQKEKDDTSSSQSTPSSSTPQVVSTPTSVHSSEDTEDAVKPYQSHALLVLEDIDDDDMVSEPLTIKPSPVRYCVDLVMDRDSPSDSHPEASQEGLRVVVVQLMCLKNTFYNIIKEFVSSLTEKQLTQIKRGVYSADVREQVTNMGMEVLRISMGVITYALSQAIDQSATMISHTCSEECSTQQVDQILPAELLRESFAITDKDIRKVMKNSLGRAFCDVLNSDRTIEIPPELIEVIVKTVSDDLNTILSESIQASLDEGSPTVPTANCCQFSSCTKCKEVLKGVVTRMKFWLTFQDIALNQRDSDPRSDSARFDDASNTKDPKRNLLWWSCLMRWWRTRHQRHAEATSGSSSAEDSGDTMSLGSGNSLSSSDDYASPAEIDQNFLESPPEHSVSSAESSDSISFYEGTNNKERMSASSQDDTIRTKKTSLCKIIWTCFCCLCCCCCNEALE